MATAGKVNTDIFTCPVCLEVMKSPKSLPCLHTFCEQCISEFILSTERKQEQKLTNYPCPVCRTIITPTNLEDDTSKWAAQLPSNFTLSSLMDAFQGKEQQKCHPCKRRNQSSHRKCEDVRAIEDIADRNKTGLSPIKSAVAKLQSTVESLIDLKQKEKEQFAESLKTTEEEATKCVSTAKEKLASIFSLFLKELSLLGDEQKVKLDDKLHHLQNVLKVSLHLSNVTSVVDDHGSAVQKFICAENCKARIVNNILPVISEYGEYENITVEFAVNALIKTVLDIPEIGKVRVVKSSVEEKCRQNIIENINVVENLIGTEKMSAINVNLENRQNIGIPGCSFCCGVCLCDQVIVCGNSLKHYITAVDIASGLQIKEHNWYYAKRIILDNESNALFVSFDAGYFEKVRFERSSGFSQKHYFQTSKIGGLALFENYVYIIVEKAIMKFSLGANIKSIKDMTFCFQTNTECPDQVLNGLAIDPKRRHLIYTSKESEMICTDLEGKQIFCFKDISKIQKPTSVTVHSSGFIFIGNETGSVHVISSDGKQQQTILDKCQKITRLCDVWMDKSEKILFLCGNEYIEMYDISYK